MLGFKAYFKKIMGFFNCLIYKLFHVKHIGFSIFNLSMQKAVHFCTAFRKGFR